MNYYYYHTRLTTYFPGQPVSAGTRKVKPDLNEARDDRVLGCSDISWTICKQSAPRSRQITTPTHHHSIFTGQMLFLMPNQHCESTEGNSNEV